MKVDPNVPAYWRWARSMALLAAKDYQRGFAGHDARLETRTPAKRALWDGSPVKTLGVYAEQGLGDSLMFSRFFPQAPCTAFLGVPGPLVRLFQGQGWAVQNLNETLPDCEATIPLMSLPDRLGITAIDGKPYLKSVSKFELPTMPDTRLKVGLVWASKSTGKDVGPDERRHGEQKSIPLQDLLPLAGIPGVQLYSLQTGEAANDLKRIGAEHLIIPLEILDFADMAAWMAELDLIISVDTAPAHLVGAMGKPGIVLLGFVASWQYQTGDKTEWYQSLEIVRQPKAFDWKGVVEIVAAKVKEVSF